LPTLNLEYVDKYDEYMVTCLPAPPHSHIYQHERNEVNYTQDEMIVAVKQYHNMHTLDYN